jgi:hypothetical protein
MRAQARCRAVVHELCRSWVVRWCAGARRTETDKAMAERSSVLPPIPRKSIPLVPIDPFREAGKHPGSFLVLSQFILPRLILPCSRSPVQNQQSHRKNWRCLYRIELKPKEVPRSLMSNGFPARGHALLFRRGCESTGLLRERASGLLPSGAAPARVVPPPHAMAAPHLAAREIVRSITMCLS